MSSDLNEIRPDPKKWEEFQIVPKASREALSRELGIRMEVMDEISDFISQYTKVQHSSFQHLRTHFSITVDGESLDISIKDQATLSILHHKHTQENLRLTDKDIILKANYALIISGALIEARVQALIDTLKAHNLLLPFDEANKIINPDKRQGNRPHDETAQHHTIIRQATNILKRNGYEYGYAKKLTAILPYFNIRGFTNNNIRQIVNS